MPESVPQATLSAVTATAERESPPDLVEPGTPGAVECQAPGCSNWFVKRSGRHIYCKAPSCTYKRGAPPEQELVAPVGAAEELLRRLQDPEGGGEVGPEVVGPRLRMVSEAQRRGDKDATYGALLDAAVALVAWADRVRSGTMPAAVARERPLGMPPKPGGQPVGLVQAALSSHRRTVTLGERRVEAIWSLLAARDALAQAEAGAAATVGTEASVAADENVLRRRSEYERAERALASLEAAWAERLVAVRELEQAGGVKQEPVQRGGANGTRGRAAA
jgi:hypothetical protein